MDKKKNIIIIVLSIILILLVAFIALLMTDTIKIEDIRNKIFGDEKEVKETTKDEVAEENQENEKSEILSKLKESLTNKEWINSNLLQENCFGDKITDFDTIKLTFSVLNDINDNSIVVVQAYNYESNQDNWINKVYKAYYNGSDIVADLIGTVHPGHGGFSIDVDQGLIVSDYLHMGEMSVTIYDIKEPEIKKIDYLKFNDESERIQKLDEYNIKTSDISIELNKDNINNYLK